MFQSTRYLLTVEFCFVMIVLVKSEGQSGLLADISTQQINKLDQFQEKILESGTKFHDYQKEHGHLIRWLIAMDWDIELAAQSLYEAQQWRKIENIDSILNETILELPRPPISINGVDFEGRPVLFTSLPDLKSLMLQGKKDKLLRYQIQMFETLELLLRESSKTTGRDVHQAISIFDYGGINFRQEACPICIAVIVRGIQNQRTFYPELFKYEVLINVPRSPESVLDPQFHKSEGRKVIVFGANRAEWSPYLHRSFQLKS